MHAGRSLPLARCSYVAADAAEKLLVRFLLPLSLALVACGGSSSPAQTAPVHAPPSPSPPRAFARGVEILERAGAETATVWGGTARSADAAACEAAEDVAKAAFEHRVWAAHEDLPADYQQQSVRFEQRSQGFVLACAVDSAARGAVLANLRVIAIGLLHLLRGTSSYDRFRMGDVDALSEQAKAGLRLFDTAGCVHCHAGPTFGDTMYQSFGVVAEPHVPAAHPGLYEESGREADRGYFWVPSLRGASETAPYFHDDSATTLHEAVARMAIVPLSAEEIASLVAFIASLADAAAGE